MKRRKIYFRADASETIGYGHFIRTLALADILKDDFDITFFTQSPSEYQCEQVKNVCKLILLPSDDRKFDDFLSYLKGEEIVVLDNYFFTSDYQKKIKEKGCKLLCIDDPHGIQYYCDVLICHGFATPMQFDVITTDTRLFIGLEWAMLRSPFLKANSTKTRNGSIVINVGGADPFRITNRLLELLFNLKIPHTIKVILSDYTFISDEYLPKIQVYKNISAQQMADLFETSAFGIFPTSTICLEAYSRGLPMIIGYYIENQLSGYKNAISYNQFVPIGNMLELDERTLQDAIDRVKSVAYDIPDFSIIPQKFKDLFLSL
jgi:Spore coat polysaccharide biosynthesis protein, predicted glycosyltransferase